LASDGAGDARPFPRRRLLLGVTALGAGALVWIVGTTPATVASPHASSPEPQVAAVEADEARARHVECTRLASEVADASRALTARLEATNALVERPDADAASSVARLLAAVAPVGSDALQVRAWLIASLARFPDDAAARAALVERLAPLAPREERLLALKVVASWPAAARAEISRELEKDDDPVVRETARSWR